jgi:hypothetical protein
MSDVGIPPFQWFHRPQKGREDHVISLCAGHAYLAKSGGWKPGAGDLAPMPAPEGCPICRGWAPTRRMKNAPLKLKEEGAK